MNDTKANKLLLSLFDDGSVLPIDDAADHGSSGVGAAYGSVNGCPVYAFALDGETFGGGFGKTGAAKLAKIYSLAAKTGAPVVGIYDAKGVRMGDGSEILAAVGECLQWTNRLSGVVPQISVVTGSCGGSLAMLAASADLMIISKKAEFFLNGPDIVAARDGKKDTSSAQLAAENGSAALLTETAEDAVAAAVKLLSYLPDNNLGAAPVAEFEEPSDGIFDRDSFTELYAENGRSFRVGFATVGGTVVGTVQTAAGKEGTVCAHASAKVCHFVHLCDAYNLPIVSVVDAKGYTPSAGSEQRGAVLAAARLANAYADATTAKVSVITGSAIGPLYIAMAGKSANTDFCLAYDSAVISPLGVEASVIVTMGDRLAECRDAAQKQALIDEYTAQKASAAAAASAGLVDAVVTPETARASVISALAMLAGKRESRMPKKHGVLSI